MSTNFCVQPFGRVLLVPDMPTISSIKALKVLNSRGDWTIKTTLELSDGSTGWAIVPEGASKGELEAICLPADQSVDLLQGKLSKALVGKSFVTVSELDKFLIDIDGTENKHVLGGNTILALSVAFTRAHARSQKLDDWEYLANLAKSIGISVDRKSAITPLFNILNRGKHAQNDLSFQEFMLIPARNYTMEECVEVGVKVYKSLRNRLQRDGFSTGVGDEGGFAPLNFTVKKALTYITECASEHYKVGEDVFLGMDVAAGSFYRDGYYVLPEEHLKLTSEQFERYLLDLMRQFKLIYLEDPFHEQDVNWWRKAVDDFGSRVMLSADDLVVTNPQILTGAIKQKLANTVIVKPNQIGTVSETLDFVNLARRAGWNVVGSHRSGDTEDPFIADLAFALGADFVKFGAPSRGERTSKFNRLLELYSS